MTPPRRREKIKDYTHFSSRNTNRTHTEHVTERECDIKNIAKTRDMTGSTLRLEMGGHSSHRPCVRVQKKSYRDFLILPGIYSFRF